MPKKHSLLIVCLLASVWLYAAERVPGQIVYADETVDATLLIPFAVFGMFGGEPNIEGMQERVRYLDAKGKKRWLRPNQAKEVRFNWKGRDFRLVSRRYVSSLRSSSSGIFLLQLIDGPVKMFEYRATVGSAGTGDMPPDSNQTVSYLLQRGDEPINVPNIFGFKKEMTEYFGDCPRLVALIEEREFKRRDLGEIVLFYNTKCKGGSAQ